MKHEKLEVIISPLACLRKWLSGIFEVIRSNAAPVSRVRDRLSKVAVFLLSNTNFLLGQKYDGHKESHSTILKFEIFS